MHMNHLNKQLVSVNNKDTVYIVIYEKPIDTTSTIKINKELPKTKYHLPKPNQSIHKCDLPFNPAGCPYIYIKGCDKETIIANKSIKVQIYGRKYVFEMGNNHPNGIRAMILCENYGINLFNELPMSCHEDTDFYDEFGFLLENCNMQITIMDFNNDNECEILLTLQSEDKTMLKTYIFKILPHPYKEIIVKYLGEAYGQFHMFVQGTNIIAPIGCQGLYNEYILASNDKIINIAK